MTTKLGFIGVGHMGTHMAARLLGAGYPLTVYDRSKEKSQAIAGARVAESPRDLAAHSEVVLISVTDGSRRNGYHRA
jgi:3-hydroxyisobutyrate dehydrogenase